MTNVPLVDTHCHLDLVKGIQKNAANEDATGIKTITVTNSPMFYVPNLNLFRECKNIRVALGMHPELAATQKENLALIAELIADARFIGEIGLDGSIDFAKSYQTQLANFRLILAELREHPNKILTVHTRNAAKETIDLLQQYLGKTDCKVILHWYSGNETELKRAVSYGYFFSVNHRMLKSRRTLALLRQIPPTQILTETDAPFTFDHVVDSRLKSLSLSLSGLGSVLGWTTEEVKLQIYQNLRSLLKASS